MSGHKIDKKVGYVLNDSVYEIHNNDIDLKAGHIYLMGTNEYLTGNLPEDISEPGVEYSMASKFIKNMNMLMRNRPTEPILIHMKTCGGDWNEGMAIHNMIKSCPVPVTILNYTHARSMSSIIFQAANKRVMMPDSHFMMHDGTLAMYGTVKQVTSDFKFTQKSEKRMLEIYTQSMKRTGQFKDKSEDTIKKMLRNQMDKKEDVFLTAQEAVNWGLADQIFGETMPFDWSKLLEYTNEELQRG